MRNAMHATIRERQLRGVRDQLAAIPSHLVSAPTRREIVRALGEMDLEIARLAKLAAYRATLPAIAS